MRGRTKMRRMVFLFILILNSAVFAQQLVLNLNEPVQPPRHLELPLEQTSDKDIKASVLIKTGADEAQLGLFTVERTPQNPNECPPQENLL